MPESATPPPKLRLPDVMDRFNMTERHVRQLVHERRIPHYKVGKILFFDQGELEDWFAAQRVETEAL